MKIRSGFVSNSSSSSFILDRREPAVRELENVLMKSHIKKVSLCGLSRLTAWGIEDDLRMFVDEWLDREIESAGMGWESQGHGSWIMEYAEKIGFDNILYVRESDEEMGGYLPWNILAIQDIALAGREYH